MGRWAKSERSNAHMQNANTNASNPRNSSGLRLIFFKLHLDARQTGSSAIEVTIICLPAWLYSVFNFFARLNQNDFLANTTGLLHATASCPAICCLLAAGCEHGWKKGLPITGHVDQIRFLHVFLEYGKHLKAHDRDTQTGWNK